MDTSCQIEFCVNYIVQCIKRMQEDGIKAMEVKMKHVESLYEHMGKWPCAHA